MATLGPMFAWRDALWNVKPDTLIRWHRKGFQLFWRWRSRKVKKFEVVELWAVLR
jgi:putative transposase